MRRLNINDQTAREFSTIFIFIFISAAIFPTSCRNNESNLPKPRTYPRIEFPEREYLMYEASYCPLRFQFPSYMQAKKDEYFFDEKPAHPCWFDLNQPKFNGTLHCSYYPVNSRMEFDQLVSDAFAMIGKHRMQANFIEELPIANRKGVSGIFFELSGPVASPYQFFLTDSSRHFLRAALYFRNQPNIDSMSAIHEFVKQDLVHLINSFEWVD